MNAPPDHVVMRQVREGDVEKLGVLFDRHHRTIFHFFLRLTGDRSGGEDLVQEVFLRILRFRNTYRSDAAFTTWMYQIARNVAADHYRKRKHDTREELPEEQEKEPVSREPNPGEWAEQRQQAAMLRAALARLSQDKRELLILSRYQDLKYEEIARILSSNVATVKVRVFRALQELGRIYFELSRGKAS